MKKVSIELIDEDELSEFSGRSQIDWTDFDKAILSLEAGKHFFIRNFAPTTIRTHVESLTANGKINGEEYKVNSRTNKKTKQKIVQVTRLGGTNEEPAETEEETEEPSDKKKKRR